MSLDISVLLKNYKYFISWLDILHIYILVFLDIFCSRLLYCKKVFLINFDFINKLFLFSVYRDEKAIRCSMVFKATLRPSSHNPYQHFHVRK